MKQFHSILNHSTKWSPARHRSWRRGLVCTYAIHVIGVIALAAWTPKPPDERAKFLGIDTITVTVEAPRVEPHAPPAPIRFAPRTTTAPVIITPQKAIVARRTFVLVDHDLKQLPPEEGPTSQPRKTTPQVSDSPAQTPTSSIPRRQRRAPQPTTPVSVPALAGNSPDTPPDFSRNPPPRYPAVAVQRGWEGEVRLRLTIDKTGVVKRVQVVKSSGHPVLDAAAVNAVKRWRARPAQKNGRPVGTTEILPIRFRR